MPEKMSDVWLFKDGLAIRMVSLQMWLKVGESQARALNATMSEGSRLEGYEYRAVARA